MADHKYVVTRKGIIRTGKPDMITSRHQSPDGDGLQPGIVQC